MSFFCIQTLRKGPLSFSLTALAPPSGAAAITTQRPMALIRRAVVWPLPMDAAPTTSQRPQDINTKVNGDLTTKVKGDLTTKIEAFLSELGKTGQLRPALIVL